MQLLANPYVGMSDGLNMRKIPRPSDDAATPQALLARCPVAAPTPMKHLQGFGGAGEVFVKDERGRMGLGSFKALGAAYVIAQAAQKRDLTGETLKLLLKAGIDPEDGYALESAAWHGMAENLELLLKAGADPKRQGILVNLPLK